MKEKQEEGIEAKEDIIDLMTETIRTKDTTAKMKKSTSIDNIKRKRTRIKRSSEISQRKMTEGMTEGMKEEMIEEITEITEIAEITEITEGMRKTMREMMTEKMRTGTSIEGAEDLREDMTMRIIDEIKNK